MTVVFTASNHEQPVPVLLELFEHYDREQYLYDAAAHGFERVVTNEWAHMTAAGSGWSATREEAEALTGASAGRHVVTVTRDDVRLALQQWLGLKSTPPQEACEGCGATELLAYYPWRPDYPICPQCANREDMYEVARADLVARIDAFLPRWLEHWLARGYPRQDMRGLLHELGSAIDAHAEERWKLLLEASEERTA